MRVLSALILMLSMTLFGCSSFEQPKFDEALFVPQSVLVDRVLSTQIGQGPNGDVLEVTAIADQPNAYAPQLRLVEMGAAAMRLKMTVDLPATDRPGSQTLLSTPVNYPAPNGPQRFIAHYSADGTLPQVIVIETNSGLFEITR